LLFGDIQISRTPTNHSFPEDFNRGCLSGHRNIRLHAIIQSGKIPDRPEAGGRAEDGETIAPLPVEIPGERIIGPVPEVKTGLAPDRPEAGGGAVDPDCGGPVTVIIPPRTQPGRGE
jgi:hypothetical protein